MSSVSLFKSVIISIVIIFHLFLGGSWTAKRFNKDQYLEIDLGRIEPIYGAIVQGSDIAEEYVTSYNVLYSNDKTTFYYVTGQDGKPKVI